MDARQADSLERRFADSRAALADVGRDRTTGGYRRSAWTTADRQLREWIADQARRSR